MIYIFIFTLLLYFLYDQFVARRKHYPPGPIPFPLVGNLVQLGDMDTWNKKFERWGKENGGVTTVWLPVPTVMVTDLDLMKEAFTGHKGSEGP